MIKEKNAAEKERLKNKDFDNLLKRMLSTPPKPYPKPAKKDAKKKTAE